MSLVSTFKQSFKTEFINGQFNIPVVTVGFGVATLIWIQRYTEHLKKQSKTAKQQQKQQQQQQKQDVNCTDHDHVRVNLKSSEHIHHDDDHHWNQHHHRHTSIHSTFENVSFFQHMRRLLPIMIPKLISTETGYLVLLGILLTTRTALSSIIAELAGKAAGYMVSRKVDAAVRTLASYIFFSIPAAYVNSLLKYVTARLSLNIRVNMNKYLHEKYLCDTIFYDICNRSDYKIDNVAEILTVDIQHFSEEVADIFTSTFKPVLDIIFFTYKFAQTTTFRGPLILYSYFFISSLCKMVLSPPLGKLSAKESELQGEFRSVHERLITNSEEVAFYDGSNRERTIIDKKLDQLQHQVLINSLSRLYIHIIDNVIIKYWATLAGYIAIFSPVLFGIATKKTATELAEDYARNSRYLASLSDAIGSFVLLGNKINELRGHVQRVGEVILTLESLSKQEKKQFVRRPPEPLELNFFKNDAFLKKWKERCDNRPRSDVQVADIFMDGVRIVEGDNIRFQNIDIISPEGKVLVEDLNFMVNRYQNVMITGPNGSGKSSLFRILGDLWPPAVHKVGEALIVKPNKKDIVFIPQKPYLVLGTLRDQVIYPHSKSDMEIAGVTDEDLTELLRIVDPKEYILNTWSWDDEKDWFHAFSGGQKQRIAMARLFYHRPQYAILDECTSAVSDEVEDVIYQSARLLGITLFTVSHRKYLKKHHDFMLTFEGKDGKWHFKNID